MQAYELPAPELHEPSATVEPLTNQELSPSHALLPTAPKATLQLDSPSHESWPTGWVAYADSSKLHAWSPSQELSAIVVVLCQHAWSPLHALSPIVPELFVQASWPIQEFVP